MAQGDLTLFNDFSQEVLSAEHDLATGGNGVKVALITTLPTAGTSPNDLSDFTEVSGGTSYVAGGAEINSGMAVTSVSGSTYKWDSSVNPSWTQDGSGPTNIIAALVYNTVSSTGIGYIDMTTDGGTTPISLQAGNVSITWNASGILTLG